MAVLVKTLENPLAQEFVINLSQIKNWKNKEKFHALDSTLGILHTVTHLILVKYQENTIIFLILYINTMQR